MDPERVAAIRDWPESTKLRHVQEFLGFANFYRRFIKDYSRITRHLIDLLKKNINDEKFLFGPDIKRLFKALKKAYYLYPILR